jgi:signal transduction histidine kinase
VRDAPGAQSPRELEAAAAATARLERRRARLRPLGWLSLVVVVSAVAGAHPAPAFHGRGSAVLAALIVYGASLLAVMRGDPDQIPVARTAALVVLLAAGAITLAALQPHGAPELAPAAAVFTAIARLPRRPGVLLAVLTTVAMAITLALDSNSQTVAASVLLCALLGSMAEYMVRAGESQERAEMLYAQLQDARDAQAEAAAAEERGRIAADLHDVLAHSLSAAAIQLQGARKLIERSEDDPSVAAAVERAGELVRSGLGDARRAVQALRGDDPDALDRLPALIEDFRRDQRAAITFSVSGRPRALSPDARLALYRGAQEALTNIARYAPRASVEVTLRHDERGTTLTIEDHRAGGDAADGGDPGGAAADAGLADAGGGFGLAGMRDRVRRLGGEVDAAATADGWRVRLVIR